MSKMQFVIVQNPEPGVVVPVHQAVNGERSWNIVLEAKLLPYNNDSELVEATQNYCKKLSEIIGKDDSGKENMWQICAHFQWEPNQLKQLAIRFHGRLLEEMSGLCGEDVQFTFEGTLTRHGEGVTITIPFTTEALPIRSYSSIADVSVESACWEFNHAYQAYCEDLDVKIATSIISFWYEKSDKTELVEVTAKAIRFEMEDDYINLPEAEGSVADRKCKLNVLKSVMRTDVSSDISILGDGGFKISAHSFFLIAQSSVLKELLQQCMFGRLKLKDVSEKCIRALLEYLYTFQISLAVKSSKVTVELFIAANKYEIQPLQDKLAKMILERRNAWFDITATLDLFLFIRKLGRTNVLDEVKGKIGQVLKSKGKVLIMESEGYQKLVVDDVNAD
ncbi:BTB/POZ domain-containing protein [Orchesella cincta]|uniref:BTB/POZ domain-containing protein n=1 Tax=Orchesella cincta TaxID=48709 RepID=A0A1D2MUC8_ORCCI|nr:BTB/POZ domain-containing protein [Orchesella cincta]